MIRSSSFKKHVYIKVRFKHVDLDTHRCCPGLWLSVMGDWDNSPTLLQYRKKEVFYSPTLTRHFLFSVILTKDPKDLDNVEYPILCRTVLPNYEKSRKCEPCFLYHRNEKCLYFCTTVWRLYVLSFLLLLFLLFLLSFVLFCSYWSLLF